MPAAPAKSTLLLAHDLRETLGKLVRRIRAEPGPPVHILAVLSRLALGPDWGLTWSLARRVGATQAKRLILTRAAIDGAEAYRLGLVDVLVPAGPSRDKAIAIAKELAHGPSAAISA